MSSDTLQLEGFDGSIRGTKTLFIGKEQDLLCRLAVLEGESLFKGRTILVIQERARSTQGANVPLCLLKRRWDCVFRVRENFEAQMVATYAANAPKPLRIVWWCDGGGGHEIPRALWNRWTKNDVTLLGFSHAGDMLGCEWDTIYFPKDATESMIGVVLGSRGTGVRSLASGISGHLTEISASGAALVWSNVGDADTRGSLYWYDPTEGRAQMYKMSKVEAVGMLDEVARWMEQGMG